MARECAAISKHHLFHKNGARNNPKEIEEPQLALMIDPTISEDVQ